MTPQYQPNGLSILQPQQNPQGMGLFGPLIGQISQSYTQEEVVPYFEGLMQDIQGKFPNAFDQMQPRPPGVGNPMTGGFPRNIMDYFNSGSQTNTVIPTNPAIQAQPQPFQQASQNASYDRMSNTFGGIGSLIGNNVTL